MLRLAFGKLARRRGFTLVELLTVMVIIGILVGLITVAVIAARARAMVARVGVDMAGLEQALNSYRDKFGEYPPDCGDLPAAPSAVRQMVHAAFVQHFARAFPRYVISGSGTEAQWNTLRTQLSRQFNIDIYYMDPTTSLTFFLGGPPEIVSNQYTGRLMGFSANPTNPFDATSASRIPPFFDFETARLVRTNRNWFRYLPPFGSGTQVAPYAYFRAPYYYPNNNQPYVLEWQRVNSSGGAETEQFVTGQTQRQPSVRPYYNETTAANAPFSERKFFNPRTFQIICAGADNNYGGLVVGTASNAAPRFPIGDITGGFMDNQTNFVRGVLEDMTK